jgi:hypothetical protein
MSPNNNIKYEPTEYKHKTCSGLYCKNVPTYYLKVAIVKKSGRFCSLCMQALEEYNLLLESSIVVEDKIGIDT